MRAGSGHQSIGPKRPGLGRGGSNQVGPNRATGPGTKIYGLGWAKSAEMENRISQNTPIFNIVARNGIS